MERFSGDGKWLRRLPMASSAFIIFVGLAITVKTLTNMGVVDIHLVIAGAARPFGRRTTATRDRPGNGRTRSRMRHSQTRESKILS